MQQVPWGLLGQALPPHSTRISQPDSSAQQQPVADSGVLAGPLLAFGDQKVGGPATTKKEHSEVRAGDTSVGDGNASVGDGDTSKGDGGAVIRDGDASMGDWDASVGDGDASMRDGDAASQKRVQDQGPLPAGRL